MEEHIVKILSMEYVTHDVIRFQLEKPENYHFVPGQATEIAINKQNLKDQKRPFTFTGLNEWDFLEFTIKTYPDRKAVTDALRSLKPGDELIIHDVWGAIQYKGEGSFIAGGAGVTPFIAIFRELFKNGQIGKNKLYFSNKTQSDIILQEEFEEILGDQFINILSREKSSKYPSGRIDKSFLQKNISNFQQQFYICGPDAMISSVKKDLTDLGASAEFITIEL